MPINAENITYSYQQGTRWEKTALSNISFTIHPNEILGIIGATGSGKSTLLQILNGLLSPDHGSVMIDGVDISKLNQHDLARIRRDVGWIGQIPEKQLFARTVFEDVAFGPRNMGCSEEDVRLQVDDALKNVGLEFEKYKDRSPFELSGGQKRRVAIAGILAIQPKYLLLDEPTAGLDWDGRRGILGHLQDLKTNRGMGIVLVSHREEEILLACDRLLVLQAGRIYTQGQTLDVLESLEAGMESGAGLTPTRQILNQLKLRGYPVRNRVRGPVAGAQEIGRVLWGPYEE